MMRLRKKSIVLALCLCSFVCGCQHTRVQAKRAMANEIKARQQGQERAKALYEESMDAYQNSDLELAQKKLRRAVAEDSRHGGAWLALGVVEFQRRRFFQAAEAFDRAVHLLPTRYEPRFNLGSVFESVGRYGKAIEHYRTALDLSPDQVEVMENLARCYILMNQNLEEAKELIDRSLAREHRPKWRRWLQQQGVRLSARPQEARTAKTAKVDLDSAPRVEGQRE